MIIQREEYARPNAFGSDGEEAVRYYNSLTGDSRGEPNEMQEELPLGSGEDRLPPGWKMMPQEDTTDKSGGNKNK